MCERFVGSFELRYFILLNDSIRNTVLMKYNNNNNTCILCIHDNVYLNYKR